METQDYLDAVRRFCGTACLARAAILLARPPCWSDLADSFRQPSQTTNDPPRVSARIEGRWQSTPS
jgi:hypothetical protein